MLGGSGMIYGRKSDMRLFVAYTFKNGSGYITIRLKNYKGVNSRVLSEIASYIEKNTPGAKGEVIITNWKELRP